MQPDFRANAEVRRRCLDATKPQPTGEQHAIVALAEMHAGQAAEVAAMESRLAAAYAMESEYREFKDALKAAGLRAVRVGTRLVIIGA